MMFDFLWWTGTREKPATPAPSKASVEALLAAKVKADLHRLMVDIGLRQRPGDTILTPIIDVHELRPDR